MSDIEFKPSPPQKLFNDDFEEFRGEKSELIWDIKLENPHRSFIRSPIFPKNPNAKFRWDIFLYKNYERKIGDFYLRPHFGIEVPVIANFRFSIKNGLNWEIKRGVLYFAKPHISGYELKETKELQSYEIDGYIRIQIRVTACHEEKVYGESNFISERNLFCDYSHILNDGSFSDLILCAKEDGTEFKVHRAILGARSPVFAAMLSHDMKESRQGRIDIEEISSFTIKKLLDFIYSCKTKLESVPATMNLMETAEKYDVVDLKMECERYLSAAINADNAVDILEEACRLNATKLKEDVHDYIYQNRNKFSNPELFEKLNSELLVEIIKVTEES